MKSIGMEPSDVAPRARPAVDPRPVRLLVYLYRIGLLAFPRRFRRRFGGDLLATFRSAARDRFAADGYRGLAALTAGSLADLLSQSMAERNPADRLNRPGGCSRGPSAPAHPLSPSSMMDALVRDAAFAARTLRRTPALTLTIVTTVALAIGAATAIFTAIYAIVLRPLPYADASELVVIWEGSVDSLLRGAVSPVDLEDWRNLNTSFEGIAATRGWRATLSGVDAPESLAGAYVSPQMLDLLRVVPLHGRRFAADDGVPGAPGVVMLAYPLWQRQFAGDPEVVGRTLLLSDLEYEVIGVLPAGFRLPLRPGAEILGNWARDPSEWSRGSRFLNAVARLRPQVSRDEGNADLARISARLSADYPDSNEGTLAWAQSLHEATVGPVAPYLYLLFGGVILVLLIAVANVANLLVARASARRDEMAIRKALGAGNGRLARQLLTEALLLAAAGGALGYLLGDLGTRSLVALAPADVPRLTDVHVDGGVLLFSLGLTSAAGLLFGLAPVLHGYRADLGAALRGTRGSTGRAGIGLRRALVTAQMAIALTLLIGSGLLINSLGRLLAQDPGFEADGVVSARVRLGARYAGSANHARFFTDLLERLEARPEVAEAGAVFLRPFGAGNVSGSFSIIGRPEPEEQDDPGAAVQSVSHNFFSQLRVPMRSGRGFDAQDDADGAWVALINEAAARRYWPGRDPVGERIRLHVSLDDQERDRERIIVGVVADSSRRALGETADPFVYVPFPQYPTESLYLLLRGAGGADGLVAALRGTVREMDPGIPIYAVRRLDELIDDSIATDRFAAVLLGAFALVAVTLGAVGIYGVIAYGVAERTGEIGVRMALGARRGDVLRLVLRETALLAGLGILIGFVASTWLSGFLDGMLYQISSSDPATFAAMIALLLAMAMGASWLPARRAARVDPVQALRTD